MSLSASGLAWWLWYKDLDAAQRSARMPTCFALTFTSLAYLSMASGAFVVTVATPETGGTRWFYRSSLGGWGGEDADELVFECLRIFPSKESRLALNFNALVLGVGSSGARFLRSTHALGLYRRLLGLQLGSCDLCPFKVKVAVVVFGSLVLLWARRCVERSQDHGDEARQRRHRARGKADGRGCP
eukprot:CAMPEP_0114114398 /NCGR_PEP_ID=MMETSP0043_2-20121206/3413_1 /TAXON_ID=464988 /ORGANISM="Hemiselmis andersenii, Strain CCMP644" /LENGTH=185 /DNA_ID=CAMNT_0001206589 /DNA_START=51 /DNA_END=605 /DNA_ORIENTATION=-